MRVNQVNGQNQSFGSLKFNAKQIAPSKNLLKLFSNEDTNYVLGNIARKVNLYIGHSVIWKKGLSSDQFVTIVATPLNKLGNNKLTRFLSKHFGIYRNNSIKIPEDFAITNTVLDIPFENMTSHIRNLAKELSSEVQTIKNLKKGL